MGYYDIGEVFQLIEEDLIASMARNLQRHLNTEDEEGLNYAMWQAEQLAALNEFRRNNQSLFGNYFSTINNQIGQILQKAHASGKMDQEVQILGAIQKGWSTALKSSGNLQGAFFRINDRKLNALIKSVKNDMQKAETAMLRMVDDEYRKIIFNSQAYYNTGVGTLSQCVDRATKDFLSKGITCIEYANGARVGIDVYSRMAIKTASTRAYLMGESTKRDEWEINTVIVNKRGVACPKCLKYVGRVFYDDVWGSTPVPSPEKYPRLSEAIAGGLYHPNCRDIHTTYFEGISTPPKPMTEAEKKEAARIYNLEQQQRYIERQIRKYKRLSDGSVDPENQERYYKKLSEWQEAKRKFVKANGDVLRRRYDDESRFGRSPVGNSDFSSIVNRLRRSIAQKKRQASRKKSLTNSGNSDIMDWEENEFIVANEESFIQNVKGQYKMEDIKNELSTAFQNGSIAAKAAFNKYTDSDSVATWNDPDGNYHQGGKVYLNALKAINNPGGISVTYFHEFGHLIDFKASVNGTRLSLTGNFGELIRSDVKKYIENFIDKNGSFGAYRKISDELGASMDRYEAVKYRAISDIFDGVTKGQISGRYGHSSKPGYWQRTGALESETFAHMFQSLFNPEDYALMKKYLPNALAEFEKMLERIAK